MTTTTVSRRPPTLLVGLAGAVALATLAPLGYLGNRALQRGWSFVGGELLQPRTFTLVGRSLALVLVVTAGCVVLGTAFAVLVTRVAVPGRAALRVLLTLPLAMPSYLLAFLWVSLCPDIAGFWGACLVLILVSYPFVMLTTAAGLAAVDPAQEEVARSLGSSAVAVLFRVTLRRVRAAIAAGALLVALYALSDFGAVAAMRYEAFTWVIYGAYRSGFNPSRAAVLSLVLTVFAIALVLAENRARGWAAASRVGGGTGRPAGALQVPGLGPLTVGAAVVVILAALALPLAELGTWLWATGPRLDLADWSGALSATAWLSLAAALVCAAAALPVGLLVTRYRSRASRILEGATYVSHGLPGIVVAISMVSVGVALVRPIYQREPLLILAYAVLFVPLAVGSVRAALESAPPRLEEVARSLGRSQVRAFATVTARLAAPGIAAGTALVLLTCMKELPVTLLLRPTGTETLATRLWTYTSVSDYAAAGPYAAALLVFAAVPAAALGAWTGRIGTVPGD